MERKFNSLKDVSDYAHSLIRDKSEKELKKLDPLEFLEWFIASHRFVAEKAIAIIKDAGVKNEYKDLSINVACFYSNYYYMAYCNYRNHLIVIGMECLFMESYIQSVATIIHEITHLEVHDHSDDFWQRYLEILKIEGLAEPGITIEDAFIKHANDVYRYPTEKLPLLHAQFLPEISTGVNLAEQCDNAERKYNLIRRNPIFCRNSVNKVRRLNNIDFKEDVIRLCKEYEVNYNTIFRWRGEYLPEFVGIDKLWNPFACPYAANWC